MEEEIKGLKIKAYDKKGKQVRHFGVFFMKGVAYGVINIDSTKREFLELRVNS